MAGDESYWSKITNKGAGRERPDAHDPSGPPDAAADLESALGSPRNAGTLRQPSSDIPPLQFTHQTPPAPMSPSHPPTPATSSEPIETIIGRESAVQGTIRSEQSIRIQGTAEAEIQCARAVIIEEGARVTADSKISASEVTISGELNGKVFCSGRVEIKPTGRVTGEINAASVVMVEGAFFDGQLRMKNRGQPDDATVPGRDEAPAPPPGRRGTAGPPGAAAARNAFEN